MRQLVGASAATWPQAVVDRVVFCTARIDAATNPSGAADQDIYLKALAESSSVSHIEYGNYVARVKQAPLAVKGPMSRQPRLVEADWPVKIQDPDRRPVPGARFMVSYLHQEEKGTDVNVAAHLLRDVLLHRVDAAIVISNDSDLRLAVQEARLHVPVGTVNPRSAYTAGDLRGRPDDGVGRHWWTKLTPQHFTGNQLPNPIGVHVRPAVPLAHPSPTRSVATSRRTRPTEISSRDPRATRPPAPRVLTRVSRRLRSWSCPGRSPSRGGRQLPGNAGPVVRYVTAATRSLSYGALAAPALSLASKESFEPGSSEVGPS